MLSDVWWLLSLNTLAGLLLLFSRDRRTRTAAAGLTGVWISIAVGTVLAHGGLWRYAIQLAPITWMLGSAGALMVASSLWSRIASGRNRPGRAQRP
jgi:hypothetical protein